MLNREFQAPDTLVDKYDRSTQFGVSSSDFFSPLLLSLWPEFELPLPVPKLQQLQ